jgi:integrase/recombinase XerD
MLRDTYAVEMLLAGVSLEDVSRLPTHESIKTTEKYYAHWVKARREQVRLPPAEPGASFCEPLKAA